MIDKRLNPNLRVKLVYDFGFKWHANQTVIVKGWAIDSTGCSFEGESLLALFPSINNIDDLTRCLENISGHFSAIIQTNSGWIAAVDRCRSFPLYYAVNGSSVFISDSAFELVSFTDTSPKLSAESLNEYIHTGFVIGNRTLFEGVLQIEAGDILTCRDNSIQTSNYFRYLSSNHQKIDFDKAIDLFEKHLNKLFENLILSLNGRTVVIPLSGGYDSRLIASMFKRFNYSNVVCYTFGKQGNPEMIISEKVAKSLGYRWIFFPITPNEVNGFVDSELFLNYADFATNASSFFIIQDYFAVKQMRDQAIVPPDSVFMPGHSGDTLGGSNFLGAVLGNEDINGITESILRNKFNLRRLKKNQKAKFATLVHSQLNSYYGDLSLWYDAWSMRESHPKLFANATKVYEYFDYSFYLPLWDKTLIDFFKDLPLEQKLNKAVYNYTLENRIFNPLDINFIQVAETKKRNFKQMVYGIAKLVAKSILPAKFIYSQLSYDPINGKVYTKEFLKKLKLWRVRFDYTSTNSIKATWWVEALKRRYS